MRLSSRKSSERLDVWPGSGLVVLGSVSSRFSSVGGEFSGTALDSWSEPGMTESVAGMTESVAVFSVSSFDGLRMTSDGLRMTSDGLRMTSDFPTITVNSVSAR